MSEIVERLRDIGLSKMACGDNGDDFFDAANAVEAERALADDAAVLLEAANEGRPIYARGAVDNERWLARYREARQ